MDNNPPAHIVVVDDEKYICNIIVEALSSFNYDVQSFSDAQEGIKYIHNNQVDLVLTDLMMGEHTGVDVIDETQAQHKDAVIILMTAHPTVEAAIQVLKKGAYDFLVKPFKLDLLRATIRRGLSHQQVIRDNVYLKEQVEFLKVTNAAVSEENKEKYMELVVNSCKKELSAEAVSLMAFDPKTKQLSSLIYDCTTDEYLAEVTDTSIIKKIRKTKSHKPVIVKEKIKKSGQQFIRTSISQPIYSRKSFMGVINIITVNRFDLLTQGQLDVLMLLGNSASSAFTNYQLYHDLEHSYMQAFTALANAIEARDAYTAGHTSRVCQLAELIASELGWDSLKLHHLRIGCTLHDIGKIGVPDSILNKQGKLTEEELKQMNDHPNLGLKIIDKIEIFKPAIPYITSHHEKYDGSGYPKGLKGDEIPIEGRLLSVADTFDAIMSDRPYRKGRNLKVAVDELRKYRGTQFDSLIVDTFIWVMKQGKIDFKAMYNRTENLAQLDEIITTETVSA